MEEYILNGHARRRLIQRKIEPSWIKLTIEEGEIKREFRNTREMTISKDRCQELEDRIISKISNIENKFKKEQDILINEIDNKNSPSNGEMIDYVNKIGQLEDECKREIKDLGIELESIQELKRRGGIIVIYNPENKKIITVYHKKEKITAEFNIY